MNLFIKILFFISIIIAIFGCGQEKREDSITLIPKGYVGPVVIIFNQTDGKPIKYEKNKRIYEIPDNGILKTQFTKNIGYQKNEFYYVSNEGKRTNIEYILTQKNTIASKGIENNKIYVFAEEYSGGGEGFSPQSGKYKIYPSISFYIGNLNNVENSFKEKYNFLMSNQLKR
jgi:hypothetical protein